MGSGYHGGFGNTEGDRRENKFKLNIDKQNKHIKGSKNYIEGKSIITISLDKCQKLINKYLDKGAFIGTNKVRVNFKMVIGYYVDPISKEKTRTKIGIIHLSKTGAHIVPARYKEN